MCAADKLLNSILILRVRMVASMIKSKILLVDDEIKACQLFSRFLSNQGFVVKTASDGKKALIQADEFQPNCILLDVRMPYGGLGLLSRFRKKLQDSIIMVSTIIEPNHVRDYLDEGAYSCIENPVNMGILLTCPNKLYHFLS